MKRTLTFLDPSDGVPIEDSIGFLIGFSLLAAASCIAMVQSVFETRRNIYKKHTVVVLLPLASLSMVVENMTLAIDAAGRHSPETWAGVVYAMEALVASCLLISTFDVTYIIYKTRHLPFCGLYDGQTHTNRPLRSKTVKLAMRTLAVLLFVLSLLINFDVIMPASPYAGRTGWSFVIEQPFTAEMTSVVLGLLPMAITVFACGRFSIDLWKYGTTSSMVVHSCPINPWLSPLFGTVLLAAAQWPNTRLFPVLSNVGILCFTESLLFLLVEVNKDLSLASELNAFLGTFDEIRNEEIKHQKEYEHDCNGDEENKEEEKVDVDEL